ncbi:hypothetical protein C874_17925 [Elizabethkingia anophelis 502]|nr:hypothetical protein C874_17925 [Elizabethkingia anophelis 502]
MIFYFLDQVNTPEEYYLTIALLSKVLEKSKEFKQLINLLF